MVESKKLSVELTIREATILIKAIQGYSPPQEDEMISVMLFTRISNLLSKAETAHKNELS